MAPSFGAQASAAVRPKLSIDEVVRTYGRFVMALGRSLLGRWDEAEDLAQDVFLQVHRRLDGVREPDAFRRWLAVVTVRMARRRLRARKLWSWAIPSDETNTPVSQEASPETRAFVARVYRILKTVSADSRIAWVLHHVEGETLPCVAEFLGCSLATAKRRIAVAQSALAAEMDHA